jgi:hypothetical protein
VKMRGASLGRWSGGEVPISATTSCRAAGETLRAAGPRTGCSPCPAGRSARSGLRHLHAQPADRAAGMVTMTVWPSDRPLPGEARDFAAAQTGDLHVAPGPHSLPATNRCAMRYRHPSGAVLSRQAGGLSRIPGTGAYGSSIPELGACPAGPRTDLDVAPAYGQRRVTNASTKRAALTISGIRRAWMKYGRRSRCRRGARPGATNVMRRTLVSRSCRLNPRPRTGASDDVPVEGVTCRPGSSRVRGCRRRSCRLLRPVNQMQTSGEVAGRERRGNRCGRAADQSPAAPSGLRPQPRQLPHASSIVCRLGVAEPDERLPRRR